MLEPGARRGRVQRELMLLGGVVGGVVKRQPGLEDGRRREEPVAGRQINPLAGDAPGRREKGCYRPPTDTL